VKTKEPTRNEAASAHAGERLNLERRRRGLVAWKLAARAPPQQQEALRGVGDSGMFARTDARVEELADAQDLGRKPDSFTMLY
jgi:hypothetical protein